MKINVTENKISIKEEQILNENEYNIHKIQFDFSSEYTDDLVKVALFSIDNHTYKKIISNNECDIPPEVLTQRGYSILGVYAYKTEQDTLVLRYSPSPTRISVYDGSYKADAENSEPITPSEIEQYQQILQNSLQQFQNQYNALVEETEGDIQAIEDELQRKVDEGYFDGEDGFSPIAKVIQKSNGATIEIEDKNGKTTADVLNGEDGYTPVRGIDYWTEEDKQEVEEEATQQIEGKIEEYNENAAEKLNQYNQNSVQKTNDYNTNAEQKMSTYNTNATAKLSTYNSNATEKFNNYNSNAEQKETNYNTNASSKLSEYNSNAETKKSAYDENATQKTNSFNTNATNKLTEYNTNHTEKMSAYNSNSTEKLNAFNENATQKTEDFDEHTEEIQDNIEKLQTENARLKATLPTTTGEGQNITLNKTAELEFKKPPLPMGNSEQVQYSGKNKFNINQERIDRSSVSQILNNTLNIVTNDSSSAYSGTDYLDISVVANQTYILSFDWNSNITLSGTDARVYIYSGSQVGTLLDYINLTGTGGTISKTFTSTTDSISIRFSPNNTGESKSVTMNFSDIMISTNGGDYEPYTGGQASPNPDYPQEITNVTGDVEVVVESANIWDEEWELGGLTSIGATITGTDRIRSKNYINVKPNQSCYCKSPNTMGVRFYNENKEFVSSVNGTNTTITIPANVYFMKFMVLNTTNYKNDICINVSNPSINGTYIPHQQQTFLFPLGNEKLMLGDYLADDGIHHVRGQVVLDGSENINWNINSLTTYYNFYSQVARNCKAKQLILCDHFSSNSFSDTLNNCYISASKSFNFNFSINGVTTSNAFNDWLSTHNTTVEYELEEEVIVPYTSAQQRVYNQIKQAISYEEQTNISSNTIALFNVEAYLDSKVILAEKYVKPSTGIPKTDLASDVQTSLNKADSALQEHQDISGKQDITDNTLTTINKTVPTAINEVNSIAKLANQAKSYSTYQAFINYLNTAEKTEFISGQSFMIQTKLVPDLWVYSVENTSVQYTYTTDEDFITYTNQATGGQVGYYKLAQLETQKVDLTDYATKTYVNNLFNSIVDGDEVSY